MDKTTTTINNNNNNNNPFKNCTDGLSKIVQNKKRQEKADV